MSDLKTLLIIDDDENNINLLIDILDDKYDILASLDANSALDIIHEEKIDLILLDIIMPKIDGFKLYEKIKDIDVTDNIPVIFITASTDENTLEKAFEIGANDYINKPFRTKEVISRINTQILIKEQRSKLEKSLDSTIEENNYLFMHAPVCYLTIDKETNILNSNHKFNQDFMINQKENTKLSDFLLANNSSVLVQKLNDNQFFNVIQNIKLKIENRFETYKVYIQRKTNNVNEFLVCLINIQKELDLSDQINQSVESMKKQSQTSMLGEMFDNIIHQWNQPLASIVASASSIEFMKEHDVLTDEILLEEISTILDVSGFMTDTLKEFKSFALQNSEEKNFNIKKTIENTINIFNKKLILNKTISFDLKDINFVGNENLLVQVISNLVNNSNDEIKIKEISNPKIQINLFEDDESIYIEVEDNAGGIKKEVENRIFDAYVTTKKEHKGTGIGLHMSREIIRKNFNGDITYKNINDGVKFTVKIVK